MVFPHPSYSPDLAPRDFWLFPKVKMTMKGKRFKLIQDIEAATTAHLKTLTKEDLQDCFRKWQQRWNNCVRSNGEYFEGVNGNVSFTVIIFLFKRSLYFDHNSCMCVCVYIYIYICVCVCVCVCVSDPYVCSVIKCALLRCNKVMTCC